MKKINKFALTAIAVISVAMILSTGISAAKQAPVRKASSPLPEVRAKQALGQEQSIEITTLEHRANVGNLNVEYPTDIRCIFRTCNKHPCGTPCPLMSICASSCCVE